MNSKGSKKCRRLPMHHNLLRPAVAGLRRVRSGLRCERNQTEFKVRFGEALLRLRSSEPTPGRRGDRLDDVVHLHQ
jgi:hypothetical protein